jgi:hypothetical protein
MRRVLLALGSAALVVSMSSTAVSAQGAAADHPTDRQSALNFAATRGKGGNAAGTRMTAPPEFGDTLATAEFIRMTAPPDFGE